MKEEYLHYIFEKRMLGNSFYTNKREPLKIIDFGELNMNAGPDFLDAKIEFDNKIWAGPIEFHVNSSDWYKHKHQNDVAYSNVIAHFVLNDDAQVKIKNFNLPTVEIKNLIDRKHYQNFNKLIHSKSNILCGNYLKDLPNGIINIQKEKSIKDRLWQKSIKIIQDIEINNGNRQKAFVHAIARAFGGVVNQLPFTQLANNIEIKWFAKLNYNPQLIEALMLGVAGILPKSSENNYVNELIHEFDYQKKLFNIKSFRMGWKYSRMRPYNFPDIRLAQFAALLPRIITVSNLLEEDWTTTMFYKSAKIKLNSFWENHYRLDRKTNQKLPLNLSENTMDLILINAIVPFIYAIGLYEGNDNYKLKAIDLLKKTKFEKNSIVDQWRKTGVGIETAFDSQSLLELKKQGCNQKKCLFCIIGKNLLTR